MSPDDPGRVGPDLDEVIDCWAGPECTQAHPYNAVRIRTRSGLPNSARVLHVRRSITPDMHPIIHPKFHNRLITISSFCYVYESKCSPFCLQRRHFPRYRNSKPILLRSGADVSSLKIEGVTGETPPDEVLSYRRQTLPRRSRSLCSSFSRFEYHCLDSHLCPSGHRTARPSST